MKKDRVCEDCGMEMRRPAAVRCFRCQNRREKRRYKLKHPEKVREEKRKFYTRHRKELLEKARQYYLRGKEELSSVYLKSLLANIHGKRALGVRDIPECLIELKRIELQLKREMRNG